MEGQDVCIEGSVLPCAVVQTQVILPKVLHQVSGVVAIVTVTTHVALEVLEFRRGA